MRIAVLADIHSNLAALEAVLARVKEEKPDAVIVAGDIINRGPRPRECLDIIEEKRVREGWSVIRGNHEDYVLREAAADPGRPDWELKLCRHSRWTCDRVRDRLSVVQAWPDRLTVGDAVVCMHASAKGNRAGLYPHMTDADIRGMVDPSAAVFCVGHTHVPFVRQIGSTLVVNAGAVGHPFDGDVRAAFVMLEQSGGTWRAEIVRVDYDRARAERDYRESGYLEDGGPMVQLIFEEFRTARPKLGNWHRLFEKLVAENHITIEASVEEMLISP